MLTIDRKYMWQFLNAANGIRSEPFIGSLDQFREVTVDITDEEREGIYVLALADVTPGVVPQEFVMRFPVYRLSTFLKLDFSNPSNFEVSNHG